MGLEFNEVGVLENGEQVEEGSLKGWKAGGLEGTTTSLCYLCYMQLPFFVLQSTQVSYQHVLDKVTRLCAA